MFFPVRTIRRSRFFVILYSFMAEPQAKRARTDAYNDDRQESTPQKAVVSRDLYLDTVNRHMLDFDFEKVCSVSLSHLNVYACLVCGKYYQGRGKSSHAYFHSMHKDHHVFINLQTLKVLYMKRGVSLTNSCKVYVLPDGYEVKDTSLDDIKVERTHDTYASYGLVLTYL